MSGLPGSGKSTYIQNNLPNARVCSADNYFMRSGEYIFDATKLGEAHARCMFEFIESCRGLHHNLPLIFDNLVVDNTNTTNQELAPYMATAAAYGLAIEIVTLDVPVDVAFARQTHGVPRKSMEHFARNLQYRKLPGYWKNTTITSGYETP